MILKRSNGVIDFERTFAEYENLVGSIETDHWLGKLSKEYKFIVLNKYYFYF